MEKLILKSEKRESSECVRNLRASKVVPCVVYGHKQESTSIKINNSDLLRVYRVAGENHVIELDVDGKKIDVLIHEVQKAPVSGDFLHVDFYALTKGEKIHTHIPLSFVGVSTAKNEGAIIEEIIKELKVKCLVTDLVDSIEVDISKLEKVGDNIKVSDLTVSDKIEIENDANDVIVVAQKAKVEKVEEAAAPVAESTEEKKEETK